MRTETEILTDLTINYPLEKIAPLEKILFLDIETTGFSAAGSCLYLIGCACYENRHWTVHQWLAEAYEDEKEILNAFFQFTAGFSHLIHFNGNNFDLPFLMQKCAQYGYAYHFEALIGIDIYRRVTPYRDLLRLENCKQKTLEKFLNITRLDIYGGGELISVFHDYVSAPTNEKRCLLLLHNSNDLQGMLMLLPILAYHDLFHEALKAKKVQANYYTGLNGQGRNMLFMKLRLPAGLPEPLSISRNGCFFKGDGGDGYLAVPLYEEEMKFFYANYKEYYYLPAEDCALHKSIASYVDKEYRQPATASTCYSRKTASFLPQWEVLIEPFFKREYQSRDLFFEITDEIKKNRSFFSVYAQHILNVIRKK